MNAVEDIDSMMIDRSKLMADGAKYFKLFEKHIPTGISGNVLIMSIGNLDCLGKMMSLNKDAKYTVVENSRIIKCLSKLFDGELDIEGIENDGLDLYNIIKELDMKFDCIIMNPPYQRNLHLKILAEAIKHLKDEKSVCVNLSPVRWLQDPLAIHKTGSDYKKFENTISKHIQSLDLFDAKLAQQMFNSAQYENLGIYTCNLDGGYDYTKMMKFNCQVKQKVFDNVILPTYLGKMKSLSDIRTAEGNPDFSRFYVILPMGHGHVGAADYYDLISPKKELARRTNVKHNGNIGTGLGTANFDTDVEAENFRLSLGTTFVKFCVSLVKTNIRNPYWAIPLMHDYIEPWTDERFYKFFNITPEEQKVIEETMEKYAAK